MFYTLHALNYTPVVLYSGCYMSVKFLYSGSNRKIKNISTCCPSQKDFFITSRLHLTSVFSAMGMFWAVDDSQSCTDPLQSRSSIVSLLLFSPFYLQVLIILAYVKMGFKVAHPQLIDNTRFKPTAFWSYGNSCNLQWLRSSGSFLSLKVWAWVGLKWSESEPRSRHRQHHCILNTRWNTWFWFTVRALGGGGLLVTWLL